MGNAKNSFSQRRKGVNLRQLKQIPVSFRIIMVKDNLSRKLVARCAAAAMALIITLSMAGVSNLGGSSESAIGTQAETSESTVQTTESRNTDGTVAYSMATYKASQGAVSESEITKATTTTKTSASQTNSETTTAAATTTKSAETSKTTSKSSVKTPAQTTAYKPSYAKDTATTTVAPKPSETSASGQEQGETDKTEVAAKPVMLAEQTYETDYTHPWNKQTNQITVHWNAANNAVKYMVFIYGGQYKAWTEIATTAGLQYTATGLKRDTSYTFAVKAVSENGTTSDYSAPVVIKTARMDYSVAGWQAMCRIVYHEVGGAAGSFWDRPIVYVADCVANQYVCAKYTHQGSWSSYYRRFSNIESIIYQSGGFASSATLSARGANYSNVTKRVKLAVWGATYGVTTYKNIANDYNIFFWNSSYSAVKNSAKLGYSFKTPFGNYVNIWRKFWG